MAAQLERSRHEVAGLLMELWEWADDNVDILEETASAECPQNVRNVSADCPGVVRYSSAQALLIDGLTGVSGFADSMTFVGWILFRNGRIVFPNFSRHNGNPAKRRASDAERKRNARPQSVRNASAKRPQESGPEKRRKEKRRKKNPPNPPLGESDGFKQFWKAYPRKVSKEDAIKAWDKLAPDESLLQKILAAVSSQSKTDEWRREKGRFIPYPASWLNAHRWEDEGVVIATVSEEGERLKAQTQSLFDEREEHEEILRREAEEAKRDAAN